MRERAGTTTRRASTAERPRQTLTGGRIRRLASSDWGIIPATTRARRDRCGKGLPVIVLGVILLVLGLVLGISILTTLGIILLIAGAVLYLLGSTGRPIGGRRHYW
jgi:hypothetical protein